MTAEMGSPLLPPSSPAYGTRGENEKKVCQTQIIWEEYLYILQGRRAHSKM